MKEIYAYNLNVGDIVEEPLTHKIRKVKGIINHSLNSQIIFDNSYSTPICAYGIPINDKFLDNNFSGSGEYHSINRDDVLFIINKSTSSYSVSVHIYGNVNVHKISYIHDIQHLLFIYGFDPNLK